MDRCAREDIYYNQASMTGLEATEEFRDDTTHYQIEGDITFYQMMLLLCDTSLSGIQEDKWIPYYSEADKWLNIYAYQIGLGGSYGCGFKPVNLA